MSQDDQRNQPNEDAAEAARRAEAAASGDADKAAGAGVGAAGAAATEPAGTGPTRPAEPTGAGAGAEPPAGPTGSTVGGPEPEGGAAAATAATAETATATPRPAGTPRREFHDPGEGASRYAVVGEPSPSTGSEQSWSAQPHPGYQPDPARRVTTRRLAISSLVGLVVLGAASYAGYSVLTFKSSNGFGAAPWTASVQQNGAGVGGINAQNNGAAVPVELPGGVAYGSARSAAVDAITKALAVCVSASAVKVPVTDTVGTTATISAWAAQSTPTVQTLNQDAVNLQTALTMGSLPKVADAAGTLCAGYPAIAALPPMPDAVGSHAWSSAVTAFSTAATDSLRGISGNPNGASAAVDSLKLGFKQLGVLAQRIIAPT